MEDVRLTEIAQILETYQAQGFIELMPAEICDGRPKNTLGYLSACVALQAKHCYQHRHFLFISGELLNCLNQYILENTFS